MHKFTLKAKKTDNLVDGIKGFALSFNGKKMFYRPGQGWFPSWCGKGMARSLKRR